MWGRLDLELDPEAEDEVLGRLPQGCLGLEVEPGSAASRFRSYWPSVALARDAGRALLRVLEEHGHGARVRHLRVESIADGRWAERYQEGLVPFALGQKFVVVPSGMRSDAAPSRIPILLVPGRAFGTGEHATTALCAEALEEQVGPGERWIDLGTGSGILSVVAAGCGAAHVLALDLDLEAVRIARRVVRANRVDEQVEVRHGSLERARGEPWDGVVANVEGVFLKERAGELAAALAADGVLISSGIPRGEEEDVAQSLEAEGLERVVLRSRGEWAMLVHRRRAER